MGYLFVPYCHIDQDKLNDMWVSSPTAYAWEEKQINVQQMAYVYPCPFASIPNAYMVMGWDTM